MKIKTYGIEYIVYLKRGKDVQTVEIIEATGDKEVVSVILGTFKNRLTCNGNAPFCKIIVKALDQVRKESRLVMTNRVFNLSPRNARIELENAIRMCQ